MKKTKLVLWLLRHPLGRARHQGALKRRRVRELVLVAAGRRLYCRQFAKATPDREALASIYLKGNLGR
jgi:hypothetical protein